MLQFSDFKGAIFDVDDTLLSNYPDETNVGLHERSRLAACHEVGKRHDSPGLQRLTLADAKQAFREAKVHTLQAAVWQMLFMAGEVYDGDEIEPDHPLLKEIIDRKEELHEHILRIEGREVPGATAFVKALARGGPEGKLAIASTACRRDIDVFMEMTKLDKVFPDSRIISRERFTHAKPHPEPYNLAFATLGLPESDRPRVVAFEDDHRGVMSAKAAGLFTCAITTRLDRATLAAMEVPPDLIADSYAEFAEKLGVPLVEPS